MSKLPLPTFAEFYRAINGRAPFPWQQRLAEYLAKQEGWPEEIGVPTGLGKTACLDIAVWWLASQADRAPRLRTAPTRIWWVVNRRLLVDSTAEHAEAIAEVLHDPDSVDLDGAARQVIELIAERLRSLWVDPDAPPLDVIRLRGGVASRTPLDPARPTVILCTLPMYGSRLLFRGYGSSRRSVDAAMAGADSLLLLDEAHLAGHLRTLIPALAACNPTALDLLGAKRSQPTVVSLTATGNVAQGHRFDLDDDDSAHPVVRQRLDAAKPMQVDVAVGETPRRLARAAEALIRQAPAPAACLVFGNTPKTAREAFERLCKTFPDAEVLLLTGLAREREAARIRARILDSESGMGTARGTGTPRRCHLIVVATQTLEVGADIDAEYLVTEGCAVRALTQRLGRLNRLGRFPHARAIYVHSPAPEPAGKKGTALQAGGEWPVYGREPGILLARLQNSPARSMDGVLDLCPRSISSMLGPPIEDPDRAPEILPGLLWEWTKTTTPPEGEAPVEPYFSGIAAPQFSVALLWRAHVPASGRRIWPRVSDREAIDVPLIEARRVLGENPMCRLAPDGVTVEEIIAADLRPGDRVIVASDAGYMDRFGWNPNASTPVVDASLANLGLPLNAVAIGRLCGADVGKLVDTALGIADDGRDIGEAERAEAVSGILAIIKDAPVPSGSDETEWTGFVDRLRPRIFEPRNEVARLLVVQPDDEALNDEFDELSLNPVALELDRHGEAVAIRARKVAERIGLPDDLLEVVERAAKWHDIGKSDERFQRWLDPEREADRLLAKSEAPRHRWEAMRLSSGWPRGGRHEDLSARLVRKWLEQTSDWGTPLQRDLLVHLVVSHHGKGRPMVPPAIDGVARSVSAVVEETPVTANADLAVIDWEQPGRFRRLQEQFGPWGLALLEAIVIRADHAVSAGVDGMPEDS